MVWSHDRTKILLGTQGSRYILNAADPTAVACAPAGSVGGAATYTKNGRIFSLAPRPWEMTCHCLGPSPRSACKLRYCSRVGQNLSLAAMQTSIPVQRLSLWVDLYQSTFAQSFSCPSRLFSSIGLVPQSAETLTTIRPVPAALIAEPS